MGENRAPVPATPFLIQQSLGKMLCRAPTQVQQEPVLTQGDEAMSGTGGSQG